MLAARRLAQRRALTGVNQYTAPLYFHKLREPIAEQIDAETPELLPGEIEVDESYSGGVEEQSAATQEIARTATTFSSEAKEVLDRIAEITQSADLSTGKSIAMLLSAEDLDGMINGFSPELEEFLTSSRTMWPEL